MEVLTWFWANDDPATVPKRAARVPQPRQVSNEPDESYYLYLGLRVFIILMLLGELAISLYLYYRQVRLKKLICRQYWHLTIVKVVPQIIQEFDEEGVYTKHDLLFSQYYQLERLKTEVYKKVFTIFLWILTVICIGDVWKSTIHFTFLWPRFIGPVVARNMTFALFCYTLSALLLIPLHSVQIMHRVKFGMWKVVDFFLNYFADLVEALLPMAIVAGLVTKLLKYLDSSSVAIQEITIFVTAGLFVIMYPLTEIWLLIRENEEHEQERNKYSTNTENVTRGRVFHLCKRVGFPNANVLYYRSPSNNASAFYFGFLWFSRVFVFQDHDHTPEPKRQSEEKKADREKKPGKKDSSSEDSTRKLSLTPSEIESVVAHELGHWYNGDSGASLILWHFRVISTCILVYYIRSSQTVHKIFLLAPAENNTGVELLPGAFVAYFFILRPYYKILEVLCQLHIQQTETLADKYAANRLGYKKNFAKALIKIILRQQTTFPSADYCYQLCYHNHPSLAQRLQDLEADQHQPLRPQHSKMGPKQKSSVITGHGL